MVKKDSYKDKPKPPNREQIIADLASAPENDTVYMHQFADISSIQCSKDNSSEHSDNSHGQTGGQSEPSVSDRDKINQTYEHVKKFIQLHSDIKSEPKTLDEKYKHLEKLGKDVEDSISELKSAADAIVKKAKK
ncbi:uncharacterized protein LOC132733829 [Ruditapes philippinarum]|uniref:uncharacterized protein LOC132733829 n=1 Tax=Ruditapes philippinarum TaxID=129788 RepID=UPI00295BA766|nr:uncharacterized protein LOC132733829 [Ruditapes philippinarum]